MHQEDGRRPLTAADYGLEPSQEDKDAAPSWQLVAALGLVGVPVLCMPAVLGVLAAQWCGSKNAFGWLCGAALCWIAADQHLPSETAHSLWARLPPLRRPGPVRGEGFDWSQIDSLLAPLVETALCTGTLAGVPTAAVLLMADFAMTSKGGTDRADLTARAWALIALPQIYLAFAALLYRAYVRAFSPNTRHTPGACRQHWTLLCLLHAAGCWLFVPPVREFALLVLDGYEPAVIAALLLGCFDVLLLFALSQLLDYVTDSQQPEGAKGRTALPPTREVLGEALALLDTRAWRAGLRRLRPDVAAAEAADDVERRAMARWEAWHLLLAAAAAMAFAPVFSLLAVALKAIAKWRLPLGLAALASGWYYLRLRPGRPARPEMGLQLAEVPANHDGLALALARQAGNQAGGNGDAEQVEVAGGHGARQALQRAAQAAEDAGGHANADGLRAQAAGRVRAAAGVRYGAGGGLRAVRVAGGVRRGLARRLP